MLRRSDGDSRSITHHTDNTQQPSVAVSDGSQSQQRTVVGDRASHQYQRRRAGHIDTTDCSNQTSRLALAANLL